MNRWVNDAPQVAEEVLRFLARHAPTDHADAQTELATGGRLRICIDVQGQTITRFRVRLLRAESSRYVNTTLYGWSPPPKPGDSVGN